MTREKFREITENLTGLAGRGDVRHDSRFDSLTFTTSRTPWIKQLAISTAHILSFVGNASIVKVTVVAVMLNLQTVAICCFIS